MFKKAFKRIRKDRVKMIVNYSALSLTLSCQEATSIRVQITRGDQRPETLELLHIQGKRGQQTVNFPRNTTPFECSYFIKDGQPDAKMANLALFATDQSGGGAMQICTHDMNFSDHFGSQFEEVTIPLKSTPVAHARNLILHSFRYKAQITPKKEKDMDTVTQCVQWRTQTNEQEKQKQAATEERKRQEEQKRQADREARERQSQLRASNEPIRGLGGFNQAFSNQKQNRTSSELAPTMQSQSLIQQDGAGNQAALFVAGKNGVSQSQRTQSSAAIPQKTPAPRPNTQQIINDLSTVQMMDDMAQLDEKQQRKSMNRTAVKLDMRASEDVNRSAVKSDLRSGGLSSTELAPAYERSQEGSSDDGEDVFKSLGAPVTTEESKVAAAAVTVEETKKVVKKSIIRSGDTESDDSAGNDAVDAAQHRGMVAMQARQDREEREKDEEIERLRNEIKSHEEGQTLLARKLKVEQEIKVLQAAIDQSNKETEEAIQQRESEKQMLLAQVAQQTQKVDEQSAIVSQLERELAEPRIKLENADKDLKKATIEEAKAQADLEQLEQTLVERRQFLETESSELQIEIAQVADLEPENNEITETVEQNNREVESKQAQIDATCRFLNEMDVQAEKIDESINECDEQLHLNGNQEIIMATSEANRLRLERNELEKQKFNMATEADEMRNKGIELQQKITAGQTKVKNIEAYSNELDGVTEDSKTEARKYKTVIEEQKMQKEQEREAAKERHKIKRKMTQRAKKERQKSQQLEIQQAEQEQFRISENRREEELNRAAHELEDQFNEAEQSRMIDDSRVIVEQVDDNNSFSVSRDQIFDELQEHQQMTPEERAEMFYNNDRVNESRVMLTDGIDASFFSQPGGDAMGQSFREDDDDGGAFNFDALMREKAARNTFGSQNNSFFNDKPDQQSSNLQTEHYQTPEKDSTLHFETGLQAAKVQTVGKHEGRLGAFGESNDKSVTEPDQLSMSRDHRVDAGIEVASSTPDVSWLNYKEHRSSSGEADSPLLVKGGREASGKEIIEDNMLGQIAKIETRGGMARDSIMGDMVLMEQIAALNVAKGSDSDDSNSNSDYDSFHSDEVEANPTNDVLSHPVPKKKDWIAKNTLTSIKEERSDSILSLGGNDEHTEIVRAAVLGSAFAVGSYSNSSPKSNSNSEMDSVRFMQESFGAVGPHDTATTRREMHEISASVGTVQAVKEVDLGLNMQESQDERPRSSSHEIRQKILLATTPKTKAKAVEELNLELTLVNKDINELEHLGEGSNSPERSLSVSSGTAVPIINPSTQDKLAEKIRIKDQIESGLKSLEDRERRQNLFSIAATASTIEVEERDPYAPTESSQFINSALRQSIGQHSRTSSFSSNSSQNRGSSRGSLYRSTNYDREKRSTAGKSRRQIYTEQAMRDIQFMLVSGKHNFSALSDYELMEGFNQFEAMLRMDKGCHEAMFGLGKLNFMIKRYELAERWFADAFAKKRDFVYRAWLGFTYIQLYKAVTDTNPKQQKYLGYAVKNLTRCVKEDDLAPFCIMALLCLSVDIQKAAKPGFKGLEEPAKYLSGLKVCLKGKSSLELGLAQAYIDLNTAGRISQGVQTLKSFTMEYQTYPEAYLMLSRHHSLRKEYQDEKRILAQALAKCTEFQCYPERLQLTLAHARSLAKDRQVSSQLEAANLLQLQYTRTPHYASSLLYAYGKIIIDCKIAQLLPNAISALEEAQRCSVSLRVHNCFAYIAKAFSLMQRFPLYVSMHTTNFQMGAKQLSYRVGETRTGNKQIMVDEMSSSSDALMFEIISTVQSLALQMMDGGQNAPPVGSPRYSTALNVSNNSRSSFQLRTQSMVSTAPNAQNRLNMFSSPLSQMAVSREVPDQSGSLLLSVEGLDNGVNDQEVQKLVQMARRLSQERDKFICQGLIIRGLKNDSAEAYNVLLSELMRHREAIDEEKDIQLQTLLVRSLRKSKQLQGRLDPVVQAMHLMEMVQESFNARPSSQTAKPPLTTVCLVEAHIEAAKLFFDLSRREQENTSLSSSTLLQIALNVLLMTLPILPQIDFKLGNPLMPVDVEQYGIADLESIDFTNCPSLQELATGIEETKQDADGDSFSLSPLMKIKIQSTHFMIQGSISIDPLKRLNEMDSEDKCSLFSFPEALAEDNKMSEIESLATWSSTSLSAVANYLQPEAASQTNTASHKLLARLAKFHVHSSPDVLKHIGKFCIKSGKYADLAIYALREYLIAMTHSKMFSLAAGHGVADQTTMQSGYTVIREKTMLQLAQALGNLAIDQKSQSKKIVADAQALVTKVRKGGNTQTLRPEINKTTELLKNIR